MKLLVTAGPTCEDIDPVRFITNRSSGRMGYALAAEAAARGHEVVLISGPVNLDAPAGARVVPVRGAAEMLAGCLEEFPSCHAAALVAAVADFRPARPAAEKIAKSEPLVSIGLERTEDIAARLGAAKGDRLLVGFALETGEGRSSARRKLADKNLDAIVLNGPDSFGSGTIRAEFLEAGRDWRRLEPMDKRDLARLILDWLEPRLPSGIEQQETAGP